MELSKNVNSLCQKKRTLGGRGQVWEVAFSVQEAEMGLVPCPAVWGGLAAHLANGSTASPNWYDQFTRPQLQEETEYLSLCWGIWEGKAFFPLIACWSLACYLQYDSNTISQTLVIRNEWICYLQLWDSNEWLYCSATTQVEAVVPMNYFWNILTKKNQYISNISNHYIVHCKYLTF